MKYYLLGLFLYLFLIPTAEAITEIETECGLFDCYTILSVSKSLPSKDLRKKFNVNFNNRKLKNTDTDIEVFLKSDSRKFKRMDVEFIDSSTINVSGKIDGASKNFWGLRYENELDFMNSTWWNSSWSYYKNITITSSDGALIDYPIIIDNFNCGGNCQEFGQDLRVVNITNNEVPYAIAKDDTQIFDVSWRVFYEGDYSIYYGNPTAPPKNVSWFNISRNEFDSWEDQDIDIDPDWDYEAGSTNVTFSSLIKRSGDYSLNLTNSTGYTNIWTTDGFFDGTTDRTNLTLTVWAYDDHDDLTLALTIVAGYNDGASNDVRLGVSTGISTTEYIKRCGETTTATGVSRTTAWHNFTFLFNDNTNNVIFYIDDVNVGNCGQSDYIDRLQIGMGNGENILYDDVSAAYSIPEISYSISGEVSNVTTTTTTLLSEVGIDIMIDPNVITSFYCIDNNTLYGEIRDEITLGANQSDVITKHYEPCPFGCDNQTQSCKVSGWNTYKNYLGWGFIIIIGLLLAMRLSK
jgi:hypothetical protein